MSDWLGMLDRGYTMMWREGRIDDALRGLGEDFEWVTPAHPEGAVRHGPEGIIEFFHEWIEPWEDFHVDWELEQAVSDRALATVDMSGRGRVSGARTEMRFFQVWSYREGRVVRMEMYYDRDAARRAAGFAEP